MLDGAQKPDFLSEAAFFNAALRRMNATKIAQFYGASDRLSEKIFAMLQEWTSAGHEQAAAALDSFKGEAFSKLDPLTLSARGQAYALQNILIGSGLYGALRANDAMMSYRLDMGQKVGKIGLRNFWKPKLSAWLKDKLQGQPLINLASAEYADSFDREGIHWIDVEFWQEKNGQRTALSVFSKQARGLMARHVCENAHLGIGALKAYSAEGYQLDTLASTATRFVFYR